MKQTFRPCAIAAFVAALLLSAPVAHADPLLVTGGSATLSWDFFSSFNLTGDNFSFSGSILEPAPRVLNAPIGKTVDLSHTVPLYSRTVGVVFPAHATVNGVSYFPIRTEGMLSVSAVPFVVSAEADFIGFATPFTMTGWIRGFSRYPEEGSPLFDFTLAGSGVASIGPLRNTGGGQYLLNSGALIDRFKPAKPVPEPATLLLLSTGLAGFAARRYRVERLDLQR